MTQIYHSDDHDTIVRKFADRILKNNRDRYKVYTNLPGDEAQTIGSHEPDIVLKSVEGGTVELIIEVETIDSLTENQASERWAPLAEATSKLQAVIPKGTLARAKRYCKRLGIKVKFQEY